MGSMMLNGGRENGLADLRSAFKAKVQCWASFLLCTGLVVVSLLVFTFAIDTVEVASMRQPWLSLDGPRLEFISIQSRWNWFRRGNIDQGHRRGDQFSDKSALQGMGTLLRVGTRPMQEIIVAHLTDDTSSEELRLFLRTLHRSGSTARADVVLLFPSSPIPVAMSTVIQEEEESFQKLIAAVKPEDLSDPEAQTSSAADAAAANPATVLGQPLSPFNAAAFKRATLVEPESTTGDIIWEKQRQSGGQDSSSKEISNTGSMSSSWAAWGSMVAFDMQELDPQNALQGFFDTPPVQLRRWVCYDMLLGMVKSRYKNALMVQVRGVFILGDALSGVRKKQSLHVTVEDVMWKDAERQPVLDRLVKDLGGAPSSITQKMSAGMQESNQRVLRENQGIVEATRELGEEEIVDFVSSEQDGVTNVAAKVAKSAGGGVITNKMARNWRQANGLIQSVYGPQVWNNLELSDKQQQVVSSGVVMGGLQFVRGLAIKMTSETVRVAIERKSRRTFHDKAILNMLVHKKSVLGKRISDHLKVVRSHDSHVHNLQSSQQPYVFWRKSPHSSGVVKYDIIHQGRGPRGANVAYDLHYEICRLDRSLYHGCGQ